MTRTYKAARPHTKHGLHPVSRLMERIRVDYETGCWLFTGPLNGSGYVIVPGFASKSERGHRLTYRFFRGPIPEGLMLDHLCRMRHCLNPWHLEPVTQRENVQRGARCNPELEPYRKSMGETK